MPATINTCIQWYNDNMNSEESLSDRNYSIWTDSIEQTHIAIPDKLKKWSEGIDLNAKSPKPFDINLLDFLDQNELQVAMSGQTPSEVENLLRANHETLLHNNAEIDRLDERILQISELAPSELEELYKNPETSDSDKSIIFCIEALRLSKEESDFLAKNEPELASNINHAIASVYGFDVVKTQKLLQDNGAHFRILTKREREATEPGSLEDITSAALESFVMNPNYDISRALDYDEYLHGIMLDCTKKKVGQDGTIAEMLDLEEFQERIIESMSWAVLDINSSQKKYTSSEFANLQKRASKMYADYTTGHHFRTDAEEKKGYNKIAILDQSEPGNIYAFNDKDKDKVTDFWKDFERRVQHNNDEAFRYNIDVARVEMKPWAEKIDLDRVSAVNEDAGLTYEDKLKKITAYIQEVFGVLNLDDNGQSQPVGVKWFRLKELSVVKSIRRLLRMPEKNADLPERYAGAYYSDSEKSIYYLKPKNALKTKLSNWDISTIAHEMWHAKQYELMTVKPGRKISTNDPKVRMYEKNSSAYASLQRGGIIGYYMQIIEREAFAIEQELEPRLIKHSRKMLGEKIQYIFKRFVQMKRNPK